MSDSKSSGRDKGTGRSSSPQYLSFRSRRERLEAERLSAHEPGDSDQRESASTNATAASRAPKKSPDLFDQEQVTSEAVSGGETSVPQTSGPSAADSNAKESNEGANSKDLSPIEPVPLAAENFGSTQGGASRSRGSEQVSKHLRESRRRPKQVTTVLAKPVAAIKDSSSSAKEESGVPRESGDDGVTRAMDDTFSPIKKPHKAIPIAIWVSSISVFVVLLFISLSIVAPIFSDVFESKDYSGSGKDKVAVEVKDGASGTDIGNALVDKGVVKTVEAFVGALSAESSGGHIQPGTYEIPQQLPASDAVTFLMDSKNRITSKITVPEGTQLEPTLDLLAENSDMDRDKLGELAKQPQKFNLPSEAKNLEGYLFPATYDFSPTISEEDALQTMVDRTRQALKEAEVPADKEWDTVILSSLVQAEGNNAADFAKMARAMENRLNDENGETAGKLQLDSTVGYGLGEKTLAVTDEQQKIDTPYNTYLHPGLPAGPINSPGQEAINAVMHPADGNWLYWVAVNPVTGETLFADTYAEHQVNQAKFEQWCQDNPGKC